MRIPIEHEVRLGIAVPGEIPVHRQKIYGKLQNEAVLTGVG